jgi:hypothetical protein
VLNVRKVVVYELLSLDGVAEKPDGFFADWDDAMDANLGAVIAAQDSVILGRRSYEEWAEYWPGSDVEPFATFINGVAKYVATSTPLDPKWANTTVVDGELVEFVRDLRNQTRSRHRRACQHLGRPGTACRGRRRRAQAGDRTGDRGQRAEAPRRLAGDSARVDPKHDLTDRLPARRLPRHRVVRMASLRPVERRTVTVRVDQLDAVVALRRAASLRA